MGRSSSQEDDEEEELMASGFRMARSAARDDGQSSPDAPTSLSLPSQGRQTAAAQSQERGDRGDIAERAARIMSKAGAGLPGRPHPKRCSGHPLGRNLRGGSPSILDVAWTMWVR